MAGLVLTGRLRTRRGRRRRRPAPEPQAAAQARRAPPRPPPPALPDLTGIAQRAIGSVTNISSTQVVRSDSPFANDPFFRYFFGDDDLRYRERRQQSLGSGVVVSADGYVLTNNHVVGERRRRGVGRPRPTSASCAAKIVGVDELTDLAVLKIDARNLPVLPWGDSSKLQGRRVGAGDRQSRSS